MKNLKIASIVIWTAPTLVGCDGVFMMHKPSCPEGKVLKGSLCEDQINNICIDPDLTKLLDTESITLCDGTTSNGKLKICNADGQQSCVITGNLVSADKTKISAGDLAAGKTIAGVTGTLAVTATTPTCTTDGQTGCLTNSTMKSVDTTAISPYDIRVGKIMGGVAGQRKSCRNGMNTSIGPAIYNYDGNTSAIGTVSQTGGTNGDWWDTVEDRNADLGPTSLGALIGSNPAWETSYYCDGSQISEVTNNAAWLVPSGLKINCDSGGCGPSAQNIAFTQIFQDAFSGLYITNVLATGSSSVSWDDAIHACNNIQSGDGTGKWRLPTQKELMEMYMGGIFLQNSAKFANRLNDYFVSATTVAGGTTFAWHVYLASGLTTFNTKPSYLALLCVR